MRVVSIDDIYDNSFTINVLNALDSEGINRREVSEVIQKISDIFDEYEVDVKILNTIIDILLKAKPIKEDLYDINLENFKNLYEILFRH